MRFASHTSIVFKVYSPFISFNSILIRGSRIEFKERHKVEVTLQFEILHVPYQILVSFLCLLVVESEKV